MLHTTLTALAQQVKLEETVKDSDVQGISSNSDSDTQRISSLSEPKTPQKERAPPSITQETHGTKAMKKSRSDYSIYNITDGKAVVAVLIEAILTTHSKFSHALGQVHFQFLGWVGPNQLTSSSLLPCSSLATISSLGQMMKDLPLVPYCQRKVYRSYAFHTAILTPPTAV